MGDVDKQEDALVLATPESFPLFPYQPYPIQLDLMKNLYEAIETKRVAIFESPTGTGKTLSLLCGSLTWLNDEKTRARDGELQQFRASLKFDDEPAWVLDQTVARHKKALETKEEETKARLEEARRKEQRLRRVEAERAKKKRKIEERVLQEVDDDEFLPEDNIEGGSDDVMLPQTKVLLDKLMGKNRRHLDVEIEEPDCTKIYYTSRTHSQLSQLVSELRKTQLYESTRFVALGSRKNLCINHALRKKAGGDLDEACRELLNGKLYREKKGKGCPFLPSQDEESKMLDFRDHVLAAPKDIEDLVTLGEELKTCPYYGSRRAIKQSELVTLPYNLLLQKSARQALNIDLKGQVVIVDEAHNLIDTVLGIHSLTLSTTTLQSCLGQLAIYVSKFRKRLASKHLVHLKRLFAFLTALEKFCLELQASGKAEEMMTAAGVVQALGQKVEAINLLEIEQYLKDSKIARKISGYNDRLSEDKEKNGDLQATKSRRSASPPLHAVESFLMALMNKDNDGRVHISKSSNDGKEIVVLRYQLLNPARQFREVVDEARAVVLAGGTMEPIGDFRTQLFPQLPEDRFGTFSCGHVIARENLTAVAISTGPKGGELSFKFSSRGDKAMAEELGQALVNLLSLVPDGMVVFMPSYAFLNQMKEVWLTDGTLLKMAAKKKIFYEPQETGSVEEVLRDYAVSIDHAVSEAPNGLARTGGALLFAVVGAKLSEGLNFSDSLARAVVVVGLPYANLGSAELKERMKYVRDVAVSAGVGGRDAGMELYENLCMKAVNQSIGRAIRHKNDWAALILLDKRYASPGIRRKLPRWIDQELQDTSSFGAAVKHLGAFYRGKRNIVHARTGLKTNNYMEQ
ncbi:DNA repair helicase [Calocera cornea HHB12733]|uniref:ATP-dependent DNA helicase CHL1 n=1 Tax=Calocera cornea HHB12733 TaxID=1353952 RepID=A0A165F7H2_9BASI|nr:DNA repair helicase [Calocera cornea HHB12733]